MEFTLPTRTLVSQGSSPGALQTLHLEEVRDYLVKLDAKQDPKDFERSLRHLHVDMTGNQMTAYWINQTGGSEKMLITHVGAGDLAKEVLPSRFFNGLKELALMDEQGGKLATMAWAKFADDQYDPSFVRTVNVQAPNGDVIRAIRSRHSQSYAPYGNLEFVQGMLDHGGEYAEMPVLDWRLTDTGMRIRFAGCEKGEINVNEPIPMVEGWNSEVGKRKVVLRGGLWKLVCTNGMGSWNERSEYNWIHRGNSERIQNGVKCAFENLKTEAAGVVDAYNASVDISIDNAFEWMRTEMTNRTSERVVIAAQQALGDKTTTPGGKLASVVDAVTLIAQKEADIFQQYELERLAASILNRGRGIALRNDGRIPAAA